MSLSFLLIAFIAGYAVGYIPMLIKKYRQLKEDIKRIEEDLFLINELRRRLKDQEGWNSKNIQ